MIVDSILFFDSSTIKKLFNANNLKYILKSVNVFLGYFAKTIARENWSKDWAYIIKLGVVRVRVRSHVNV